MHDSSVETSNDVLARATKADAELLVANADHADRVHLAGNLDDIAIVEDIDDLAGAVGPSSPKLRDVRGAEVVQHLSFDSSVNERVHRSLSDLHDYCCAGQLRTKPELSACKADVAGRWNDDRQLEWKSARFVDRMRNDWRASTAPDI